MGDTLVLEGKPGEARSHLEQALVNFQQVGTRIGVIWANYSLSRLAMSSGERLRALELARTAAQRAHEVHSPS